MNDTRLTTSNYAFSNFILARRFCKNKNEKMEIETARIYTLIESSPSQKNSGRGRFATENSRESGDKFTQPWIEIRKMSPRQPERFEEPNNKDNRP